MKVTKLHIDLYQQFKNLELDFTYPKGHNLEGKPLKKVCFIGQSGTGKTTLLNLLKIYIEKSLTHGFQYVEHDSFIEFVIDSYYFKQFQIVDMRDDSVVSPNNEPDITSNYEKGKFLVYLTTTIESSEKGLFSKVSVENSSVVQKPPTKSIFGTPVVNKTLPNSESEIEKRFNSEKVIVLDASLDKVAWKFMLQDIDAYDTKIKNKGAELIQKGTSKSIEKTLKELDEWKLANPNPRVEIAEKCLNKILDKFHLDVDTENLESYISIKPKNLDKTINYTGLSTGTKQILLTALPIYKFASERVVFLFDEPERSLFPDLQQMLVDYYVSLAPDAQFFFATHSPVVASQFEPCERFILYFDEEGNVKVRNGVAPQGDDPNDILKKDFQMEHLMTSKGIEKYHEYLTLISLSRKTHDKVERDAILDKIAEIAETYNY